MKDWLWFHHVSSIEKPSFSPRKVWKTFRGFRIMWVRPVLLAARYRLHQAEGGGFWGQDKSLVDLVVTWCCYRYQHDPDMFWWFLMDVDLFLCLFIPRRDWLWIDVISQFPCKVIDSFSPWFSQKFSSLKWYHFQPAHHHRLWLDRCVTIPLTQLDVLPCSSAAVSIRSWAKVKF